MKKIYTLLPALIICSALVAQKHHGKHFTSTQKDKSAWTKSIQFSLFAGQAGGKNWASGSERFSVSANAFLNAYANRNRGRWYFNNSLIASYGEIYTDEYGTIKNDDKIDFFSSLGARVESVKHLGVGAAFNFRSQFSNGYDRDYLNQGLKRRTSGFFAPAYITLAPLGIQVAVKHFSIYATPLGFRGVFVSNAPYSYAFQGGAIPANLVNIKNLSLQETTVADMYGVDPSNTLRFEMGPYISGSYNEDICKNVTLTGRLDLFSDVLHNKPANVDVFWTNTFSLKVNRWLNVMYGLDMAYDDNVRKFGYYKNSAGFQVKSVLGVGIGFQHGGHHGMHRDGMHKDEKHDGEKHNDEMHERRKNNNKSME